MSIYREEAMEARSRQHALGSVRIPTPRSLKLLITAGIASTLVFCGIGLSLPYGRSFTAAGVVEGSDGAVIIVQAWVPEPVVAQLRSGTPASVRYRALPVGAQSWASASVRTISRVPGQGNGQYVYPIEVIVPAGGGAGESRIQPGMVAEVRLTSIRQRLYRWIFVVAER